MQASIFSGLVLGLAVALPSIPAAASVIPTSITVHAEASASGPNGSTSNTPPDVVTAPVSYNTTYSNSASADAHAQINFPPFPIDGSSASLGINCKVTPSAITGAGSASNSHGTGSFAANATGTVTLQFTLDADAPDVVLSLTNSNDYVHDTVTVAGHTLDSNSYPNGATPVAPLHFALIAGTYTLTYTFRSVNVVGTASSGNGGFSLTNVPEPATLALFLFAVGMTSRRPFKRICHE